MGEDEEVEQGKRAEIVKALVSKVEQGRGALEGTKESGECLLPFADELERRSRQYPA